MRECYFDYDTRTVVDLSPSYVHEDYEVETWIVARISTPAAHRGKGIARRLVAEMLADADREGVRLALGINPYGDMDYKQLLAWYQRLGFVGVGPGWMEREPSPVS